MAELPRDELLVDSAFWYIDFNHWIKMEIDRDEAEFVYDRVTSNPLQDAKKIEKYGGIVSIGGKKNE